MKTPKGWINVKPGPALDRLIRISSIISVTDMLIDDIARGGQRKTGYADVVLITGEKIASCLSVDELIGYISLQEGVA